MDVLKGVYGVALCGVPFRVSVGSEGGDGFIPRFLDEEDVGVIGLEDRVDACIAPLSVDGSYFDLLYCHNQASTLAGASVGFVCWEDTVAWDVAGWGRLAAGHMFFLSGQVSSMARWPVPGLPA